MGTLCVGARRDSNGHSPPPAADEGESPCVIANAVSGAIPTLLGCAVGYLGGLFSFYQIRFERALAVAHSVYL